MKKIVLLLLFIIIPLLAISQEQLPEPKTNYISDSKIYWNKNLPIYITLSSPETDFIKLVKPFYLDTEGLNYLRTKWEMDSTGKYITPFREQLWKIYADSKPPISTIKIYSESSYTFKDKKYYSEDLQIEILSTDELSGVNKIYYSIDNQDFKLFKSPLSFSPDIDINLKFYAVDNVGNIETIEKLSYEHDNNVFNFGIDNKAPITSIENMDYILSTKDKIILNSDDGNGVGVNSIYYQLNENKTIKYIKPIYLNLLEDGKYSLKYFSIDWINNKEDFKYAEFYLDAIPPEIKIKEEIIDNELTQLRKITLSAIDNKSGVDQIYVQLNSTGEFIEYSQPFFINIYHYKLTIKAIDKVGNQSIRVVKYSK